MCRLHGGNVYCASFLNQYFKRIRCVRKSHFPLFIWKYSLCTLFNLRDSSEEKKTRLLTQLIIWISIWSSIFSAEHLGLIGFNAFIIRCMAKIIDFTEKVLSKQQTEKKNHAQHRISLNSIRHRIHKAKQNAELLLFRFLCSKFLPEENSIRLLVDNWLEKKWFCKYPRRQNGIPIIKYISVKRIRAMRPLHSKCWK